MAKISLNLIKVYQGSLRTLLPCSCRFVPSCSEYARLAILKYGFMQGIIKALRRLLLCHPFSGKAGYDPLI
ncbi:MAG: membrane protein insertion efficiency factor YidD [Candidatus Omnitrophica bacterium]|nr:membrane protein insertion efficiency factor YidD [Candidatus Omnitrophota bacterium]